MRQEPAHCHLGFAFAARSAQHEEFHISTAAREQGEIERSALLDLGLVGVQQRGVHDRALEDGALLLGTAMGPGNHLETQAFVLNNVHLAENLIKVIDSKENVRVRQLGLLGLARIHVAFARGRVDALGHLLVDDEAVAGSRRLSRHRCRGSGNNRDGLLHGAADGDGQRVLELVENQIEVESLLPVDGAVEWSRLLVVAATNKEGLVRHHWRHGRARSRGPAPRRRLRRARGGGLTRMRLVKDGGRHCCRRDGLGQLLVG
ncbi:hypothetical protein CAOG_010112 [Capsaspora owczarzaki ATCC 30864]|uniref:Uncharacterized protein n=1 Tax=Capsaspora owczarzaki (strain ATCC 30864) TaxID=595528 RepID=A0A0D2VZP6_CAPO3|nr:hypothetical protein CAOG_010112 [Capsaspora owczarzaki ATCC 30864]